MGVVVVVVMLVVGGLVVVVAALKEVVVVVVCALLGLVAVVARLRHLPYLCQILVRGLFAGGVVAVVIMTGGVGVGAVTVVSSALWRHFPYLCHILRGLVVLVVVLLSGFVAVIELNCW